MCGGIPNIAVSERASSSLRPLWPTTATGLNASTIRGHPPSESTHYDYFNFARALLLILGLILHAAWFCRYHGALFQEVYDLIHSFRMQGFFLIAGFFAAQSLSRMPPGKFLYRRMERLAVPLTFCFLLFVGIEELQLHLHWNFAASMAAPGTALEMGLTAHLWFLRVLILFSLALSLLHWARPSMIHKLGAVHITPAVMFGLAVGGHFLALHWTFPLRLAIGHPPHFAGDLGNALLYAPWFAAGYGLFHHQSLIDYATKGRVFNLGNAAAFLLAKPFLELHRTGHFLAQLWEGAYLLSMVGLVLWLAGRFFSDPHPGVRAVADASYTIYLFHWPIMVLCYEALYSPVLPPTLTFLVLIVTVGAFSFWIHVNIVQRWWVCRWFVNGIPPAGATAWRKLLLYRRLLRQDA